MAYRNRLVAKFVENSRSISSPPSNQSSGLRPPQIRSGIPTSGTQTRIPAGRSGIARPTVGASTGIPARRPATGIPARRPATGIPSVRSGSGPATRGGTGIPAARGGTGIPAARGGTGIPATRIGSGIPAARPVSGIPSTQTSSRIPGIGVPRTNLSTALPTSQNRRSTFGGATLNKREIPLPQTLTPPSRFIPQQDIERISERIRQISPPRCIHSPPQNVNFKDTVSIIGTRSTVSGVQPSPVNMPPVRSSPPPQGPSQFRSPQLPRSPMQAPSPTGMNGDSPDLMNVSQISAPLGLEDSLSPVPQRSPPFRSPTFAPNCPHGMNAGSPDLMNLSQISAPLGLEDSLSPVAPKSPRYRSPPTLPGAGACPVHVQPVRISPESSYQPPYRTPMRGPAGSPDLLNLSQISAPYGLEGSLSPVPQRTSPFRPPTFTPTCPHGMDADSPDQMNLSQISAPQGLEDSLSPVATQFPRYRSPPTHPGVNTCPIHRTPMRGPAPLGMNAGSPDLMNLSQISAPPGLEDALEEEMDEEDAGADPSLKRTLNQLVEIEEEERRDIEEDLRVAQDARRNYYIQQARNKPKTPASHHMRVLLERVEECGGFDGILEEEAPGELINDEREGVCPCVEDLMTFDLIDFD